MNKFLITDTSGNKSLTATAFAIGFLVAAFKFLVSGITIYAVQLPEFGGGEFAVALAALGGIYILRRSKDGGSKDVDK